jgi:hypothetical protein
MRRLLLYLLPALALAMAANAATVTCMSTPIQLMPGLNPTVSFTCDGLTFSNFDLINLTGTNGGHLDINNVTYDTTTNIVNLNENPNLGSGGHENLLFTVTGPLVEIDMSVGGTLATVTERACANPVSTTGTLAGLCTNAAGTTNATPLGQFTVSSGELGQPIAATFGANSPTYIYKDIAAGVGGGLSDMNESFGSGVPEPATMTLLGASLLGLGMLRRRASQK